MSAWGATGLDDLTIRDLVRPNGTVSWVEIGDGNGAEVLVRFDVARFTIAAALDEDRFIFADPSAPPPPVQRTDVADTDGFDIINGRDLPERFIFQDDGIRDVLKNFDLEADVIDVSAWDVCSIEDLDLTNVANFQGIVRWVEISDGQSEVLVRFDDGTADAALLGAENFVFAEPVAPQPPTQDIFQNEPASDPFGPAPEPHPSCTNSTPPEIGVAPSISVFSNLGLEVDPL